MLYKFYGAADEAATTALFTTILDQHTMLASDPRTFNDPFEFRVILDLDAPLDDRRSRFFTDQPGKTDADFLDWSNSLDDSRWYVETATRSALLASHGVLCFTLDPHNHLPWSHYSRHHTGFCLGFDDSFLEVFDDKVAQGNVNYTQQAPVFRFFYESDTEFVHKTAFHKALCWSYEQEYRIVLAAHGLHNFPHSALREVTLGCRASLQLRTLARSRLDEQDIGWFQMVESSRQFELRREAIEFGRFVATSHF